MKLLKRLLKTYKLYFLTLLGILLFVPISTYFIYNRLKLPESYVIDSGAKLSLESTAKEFISGSSYYVTVALDPHGNSIVAADIKISFDPNILYLTDIKTNNSSNFHVYYPVLEGDGLTFNREEVLSVANRTGHIIYGATTSIFENSQMIRLDRVTTPLSIARLTFEVRDVTPTQTALMLKYDSETSDKDCNVYALTSTSDSPQEVLKTVENLNIRINSSNQPTPTFTPLPTPTATPIAVVGSHRDGKTWCSNHGGIAKTIPYDIRIGDWTSCLSWCDSEMSASLPLCQYNGDGPKNCWVNYPPGGQSGNIQNCNWLPGPLPYGAWWGGYEQE